jgi:hypothetical protein
MKQMTIEELVNRYFEDWNAGVYTYSTENGEAMMPGRQVCSFFIKEAKSMAIASTKDIMAEAYQLEEAIDESIHNWQ